MSTHTIPGVPTDGLKPADLLWASILNKPLLFPPSPHSHVAGDLPGNIAFKDQANTFTADQNYLLGNSAIDLTTSGWPAIAMRHTGQGENKFVSPAGDVYHNQSAETVWSTNGGIENFRISNVGNVAVRGTLTLSGANAVISATGNDAYVAGHWNVSYGVWCSSAWLGGRAHGMTYGAGGELELQALAIKRVTIGNDYTTKFYNSSGNATVLINGTAGTITTSNGSGSSVNITTNENAGYAGTPLYTDLNFCGYGGGVNGSIRMSDISATSSNSGPMQFFTRVSTSTLERMRISADGNVGIGSTNPTERLSVAGNITASGTVMASGTITSSGYVFGTNGVLGGNSWLGLNSTASYLTGTTIFRSLLDVAGVTIDGTEGTIAAKGPITLSAEAPILKFNSTNLVASQGIEFTSASGAQFEASIKHQVNSGDMTIDVGRGVAWGGALNVVLDTVPTLYATAGRLGVNVSPGYPLDVYKDSPGIISRFANTVGSQVVFQDAGGGGLFTPALSGWYTTDAQSYYLASGNSRVTITNTGNISADGHVTSVIQSLSTDPTGADLASGQTRTIKNTSTGTTKVWLNDGGAFKSLTFV